MKLNINFLNINYFIVTGKTNLEFSFAFTVFWGTKPAFVRHLHTSLR